ncbi:MAG: short-chain fatty acid transporter [Phycisphaera sp.]|nr:short-chain fatty acid transporter [Phycisphaera sp.]
MNEPIGGPRKLVAGLGLLVTRTIGRWVPDPFLIAIGLTAITAILALTIPGTFATSDMETDGTTPSRVSRLLEAWWSDDGLWKFLKFGMQMALVLVTGYALAASPPIRRGIDAISSLPRSTTSGVVLVSAIAVGTGLLNWGLALVVGALLARGVGRSLERRGIPCHYPLLVAAGYTGLLVWHGGFSGSAPLQMTTPANAAAVLPDSMVAEYAANGIPLSETILSPMNLFVSLGLLLVVPLAFILLVPSRPEMFQSPTRLDIDLDDDETSSEPMNPLEVVLGVALGIALLAGFVVYLDSSTGGIGRLGLNQINAAMLGLGLILHGAPTRYLRAVEDAAKGCAGIIVQFPLYAGVMAMMAVSGLLGLFAEAAIAASTPATLPLFTTASAAIVNIFVPSGGGQWAVQGPIALVAGVDAGVPVGKMVMSVAYGDQLTNMLQPFWALPLLAITRVKARDIVGYTALVMLVAAVWITIGLLVF